MKTRLEGGRDLDRALLQMKRATARAAVVRTLLHAAEPLVTTAKALAPKDEEHLANSIAAGTKLTRRQKRLNTPIAAVEVYVGPNDPAAVPEEFGWIDGVAQPYMRPAWAIQKLAVLSRIGTQLWIEISRSALRAARRAARRR